MGSAFSGLRGGDQRGSALAVSAGDPLATPSKNRSFAAGGWFRTTSKRSASSATMTSASTVAVSKPVVNFPAVQRGVLWGEEERRDDDGGSSAKEDGGVTSKKTSTTSPPVTFAEGVSLAVHATPKFTSIPMGKDTVLSVLASLVAQESPPDKEDRRNPIDLVVVLDVSGSMAGEKLNLCKQTINFLLDQALTEEDFFAIVTFFSSIKVAYKGGKMTTENKAEVRRIVRNIADHGCTNLSEGLFEGLNLLEKKTTATVSAVCLLTDGLMNEGITDPEELITQTRNRIDRQFVNKARPSVFTFGYGLDVDASFLKRLSESADGTFYRIENPESVPIAFADCLGGLTSVAAQGIELRCDLPDGVEFDSPPLTSYTIENPSPNRYVIRMKDMYCGEHRDVIFQIRTKKADSESPVEIPISCTFTDTIYETAHTIATAAVITRYAGDADPTGPPDGEVMRHLARFEALNAIKDAQKMGRKGELAEARKRLDVALQTAKGIMEDDDTMLSEVVQDLEEASKTLKSQTEYERRGSGFLSSIAQAHGMQRSNQTDKYLHSSSEAVESSAYANMSKKKMIIRSKAEFNI